MFCLKFIKKRNTFGRYHGHTFERTLCSLSLWKRQSLASLANRITPEGVRGEVGGWVVDWGEFVVDGIEGTDNKSIKWARVNAVPTPLDAVSYWQPSRPPAPPHHTTPSTRRLVVYEPGTLFTAKTTSCQYSCFILVAEIYNSSGWTEIYDHTVYTLCVYICLHF